MCSENNNRKKTIIKWTTVNDKNKIQQTKQANIQVPVHKLVLYHFWKSDN